MLLLCVQTPSLFFSLTSVYLDHETENNIHFFFFFYSNPVKMLTNNDTGSPARHLSSDTNVIESIFYFYTERS